jgi:hypothetical protein
MQLRGMTHSAMQASNCPLSVAFFSGGRLLEYLRSGEHQHIDMPLLTPTHRLQLPWTKSEHAHHDKRGCLRLDNAASCALPTWFHCPDGRPLCERLIPVQ